MGVSNFIIKSIEDNAFPIAILILIAISFAFLIREIALWYWKVNDVIDLLEKIERNTRKDHIKNNNIS
ncbi:MAG: hypothetical protein ACD_15C00047G0002 [uncultured bacterium]|nr:MAG: hypothetical protein ACD_15C00047G0002 [uncultured bacterium]HCU70948.1 hypothetical protein [Candidatus Moranbacteria bacterium]